jgi:signal transduction histidine kinase
MLRSRLRTPPAHGRREGRRPRCHQCQRRTSLPHLLTRLRQCLPTALDLDGVMRETTRGAATLMRVPAASFWRVDAVAGRLHPSAFWSTTSDVATPPPALRLDQDAVGWVARHRQPLQVSDLAGDRRFVALDFWQQHGWRSFLGLPIFLEDTLFAVLACHGDRPFALRAEEQGVLQTFVASVAIALQHAILYTSETTARQAAESSAYAQTMIAVRHASLHATESMARAAIEAVTRAKDTFLANMSHELRTPLNAIINYSELLQEEVAEHGHLNYSADLRRIHAAGKHLLALISDILDFAKIESGTVELHHETFHIPAMVHEIVATLQLLLAKHTNTIEVHIADDVQTLHADKTKVQQSLLHLLSNACKFTSHGHIDLHVTHATTEGHTAVQFQVCDSGIGMHPEDIHKLFQPFTQADETTTRQYGGTGLGLAISQRLCRLMGGEITVTSTLGQGSTFTMYIPVQPLQGWQTPAQDWLVS